MEKIAPTDVLKVFKSTVLSSRYVTPSGKVCSFIGGKFYTKDKEIADFLTNEIARGNPHLFIDKNEAEIVAEDRDPMVALTKKVRAQILAEMAAAQNKEFGKTEKGEFVAQSTRDIAPVTIGGASPSDLKSTIAAKLK